MSINTSFGSSGDFLTTVSVSIDATVLFSIGGDSFLNFPIEPGDRARSLDKNFRPKYAELIVLATLQASIGAIAKAGLVGEELLQRQTNWTCLVSNLRRKHTGGWLHLYPVEPSRAEASHVIRLEEGSPDPRRKRPGLVAEETLEKIWNLNPSNYRKGFRRLLHCVSEGCPPTTGEENQLIVRRIVVRRLGRRRIREKAEGGAGGLRLRERW